MWQERHGSNATYRNLIHAFERAGYKIYADTVRRLTLHKGIKVYIVFALRIQIL